MSVFVFLRDVTTLCVLLGTMYAWTIVGWAELPV